MEKESKSRNSPVSSTGNAHEGLSMMAPPPFQLLASSAAPPLVNNTNDCCGCESKADGEELVISGELNEAAAKAETSPDPKSIPEDQLASIGKLAMKRFGPARLKTLAAKGGIDPDGPESKAPAQGKFQGQVLQRQVAETMTFGRLMTPFLGSAGVTSLADGPLPIGELIGLGILAVGLVYSGIVLMSAPGNQADTGIMGEAQELIRAGRAATICAALEILLQLAKAAGDTKRVQRIKTTQKAKGCRHSRHS